jgi:hypothetical protein
MLVGTLLAATLTLPGSGSVLSLQAANESRPWMATAAAKKDVRRTRDVRTTVIGRSGGRVGHRDIDARHGH